ncbi:MAG: hypothetical protein B6U77_00480 [Candidatus Hecatellales archaeon ex4484_218]|nr:MAG: hypothetical protein B6U77_00480 [Candidatus Hecatellales archaeon ex4484_218]
MFEVFTLTGSIGKWLQLLRANFLVLTVITVFAGLAASFYQNHTINFLNATLCLIGALLAHMAVNVFNNYFDYKLEVDKYTPKTPFSGGINLIVNNQIKPSTAFQVGVLCLIGAGLVGVYFLKLFFWPLFPIIVYGAISIYFYTAYLSRIPALSEIIAGTNYGFIMLGASLTQYGNIGLVDFAVFILVSMLVGLLLFLNEFPDVDADKMAGRKHLIILLGRKKASKLYVALLISIYSLVVFLVGLKILPLTCLLVLVTGWLGYKASCIVLKNYDSVKEIVPALAFNVLIVLTCIGLIGVGLVLGSF